MIVCQAVVQMMYINNPFLISLFQTVVIKRVVLIALFNAHSYAIGLIRSLGRMRSFVKVMYGPFVRHAHLSIPLDTYSSTITVGLLHTFKNDLVGKCTCPGLMMLWKLIDVIKPIVPTCTCNHQPSA